MKDQYGKRPLRDARAARMRLISGRLRERRKQVVAPLRRGVFLIPATITSISLLLGFYSFISVINGHFTRAALMIVVAFFCDGLDGRVARLSRTSSQFGAEYDSLSDVVAFGVAPAGLAYAWALAPLHNWGAIICGLFVVCAALRLARFNVQAAIVDKRRFVGLPVPGAAALVATLALAYNYFDLSVPNLLCVTVAALMVALAALMVSRVPYPSFKAIDFKQRAPVEILMIVLVGAAFLFAVPQVAAFLAATAYVLSGPILRARGERVVVGGPELHQATHEDDSNATGPISARPGGSRSTASLP